MDPVICDKCLAELQIGQYPFCGGDPTKHVFAHNNVISDGIPGGVWIHHLSSMPKRFYSQTDIKRACNELGWSRDGDTPGKPYKVKWSGRREENRSTKQSHR